MAFKVKARMRRYLSTIPMSSEVPGGRGRGKEEKRKRRKRKGGKEKREGKKSQSAEEEGFGGCCPTFSTLTTTQK